MTDKNKLATIITDPNGTELLVKEAEDLGKSLAQPPGRNSPPLTTSQIRSIYGEVLRIKADWLESRDDEAGKKRKARAQRALILLKPKMAYRAKKEKGRGVEHLVAVLDPAVDLVKNDKDNFRRFVEFFEAILAYHKAHGGN